MAETSNALANHWVEMPTGVLTVEVEQSDLNIDELCSFAARRNPKRGFLFVSHILGKHIPIRPATMRDGYRRLADKVPKDLPGPIVFIGMAETATALGHGVYEEFVKATGRDDLVFIHTTRYELDKAKALNFAEEHSHATDHILYLPEDERARQLFQAARTLVLVDDEASTGKTFINLTKAFLAQVAPQLQHLVTVVITDWRGQKLVEERHQSLKERKGISSSAISLLSGSYSFAPHPDLCLMEMPRASGNGERKDHLLRANFGRLGLTNPFELHKHLERIDCTLAVGEKCLVLGVGEFSYLPFLLAERLEQLNPHATVAVQSTTRSPIMLGGAIERSLAFGDHCQEGIDNYLHNGSAEHFDRVIICTETPANTIDGALLQALGAEVIEL